MPLIEDILKTKLFLVNLYTYHTHLRETVSENNAIYWITEKKSYEGKSFSINACLNTSQLKTGASNQKFYRHKELSMNDLITRGGGGQPKHDKRGKDDIYPFYRTRVRSLVMLVSDSLTDSLTDSLLFSGLGGCEWYQLLDDVPTATESCEKLS